MTHVWVWVTPDVWSLMTWWLLLWLLITLYSNVIGESSLWWQPSWAKSQSLNKKSRWKIIPTTTGYLPQPDYRFPHRTCNRSCSLLRSWRFAACGSSANSSLWLPSLPNMFNTNPLSKQFWWTISVSAILCDERIVSCSAFTIKAAPCFASDVRLCKSERWTANMLLVMISPGLEDNNGI